MKVLLVSPSPDNVHRTTGFRDNYKRDIGTRPPLGLLYVAAYLKKHSRHDIQVVDCGAERLSGRALEKMIEAASPDLVGIHTLTFALQDALSLAGAVKRCRRDTLVALGGVHASVYPMESLMHRDVDFVVRREAEISFCRLVEGISGGGELRDIPGIGFKEKGAPVLTSDPQPIQDLDALPLPDRSMLAYRKYRTVYSWPGPSTIMLTSRGCPYSCVFCERMGNEFRAVSPARVVEEVRHCLLLGIRDITFCDDTFAVDRKRVMEICGLVRRERLRFTWDVKTRVDTVDREMLFAMKAAGCSRINFGVESASQDVLDRLGKGITTRQIEEAFASCREAGIRTTAFVMLGSPGETREEMERTYGFVKRLGADYLQLAIAVPCPGTRLYKDLLAQNAIPSDVWKEYALDPQGSYALPPLATASFSLEELQGICAGFYKRFYLSPLFMLKSVAGLRALRSIPVKLKIGAKLLLRGT